MGFGTTLLPANAIRATGSDELKARILPGVAAGETLICLGYTAGRRVRRLRLRDTLTAGRRRLDSQRPEDLHDLRPPGRLLLPAHPLDPVRCNGHARPDDAVGALDSPGIEIQPVHTIGHERTNVVFYNDVRVADANRVGEPHQGFAVMRAALEAEQNVAPGARTRWVAEDALEFARAQPGPAAPHWSTAPWSGNVWHEWRWKPRWLTCSGCGRLLDSDGQKPGPVSALFGPESYVRASAAAVDIAGAGGLLDWTDPQAPVDGLMDAHYRSAVATTIYGGSSEVLRSLIVENRLGFRAVAHDVRPGQRKSLPPSTLRWAPVI